MELRWTEEAATDLEHIADYLFEEVINRQPSRIRQFLTHTSILRWFTAPLCEAVTETADAAEVIDLLERQNLFVVPLDEDRQWFRYHRLFRQTLRRTVRRVPRARAAVQDGHHPRLT